MSKQKTPLKFLPWIIWSIAAIFYTYEFVHRVSPNVMTAELMADFQIYAVSLGSLSAFYFYSYALCQIPVGLFADRYPITRLLIIACLITLAGSFLLSSATNLATAEFARLLIGMGSAFGFVCCLKLGEALLHPEHFPLVVGITSFSGTLGAFLGGAPLAYAVVHYNWRPTLWGLSLIGVGIFILMILFFSKSAIQANTVSKPERSIKESLIKVLSHKQTWCISIYASLLVAPIGGFIELWCTPFLLQRFPISHEMAAFTTSIAFAGIAIGGPTIGYIASRTKRIKLSLYICTLLALASLCLIIYNATLNLFTIQCLIFIYGAATSNMLLCFSLVRQYHRYDSGIAISFTNTLGMSLGALFQPIVGKLLDMQHQLPNTPYDFPKAFSVLPACLITALIVIYFIRIPKNSVSN